MSNITDTNDVPVSYLYFSLPESSDGPVVVIRAPGGSGKYLIADEDATLRVLGRRNGTANPFVDLSTSPLHLDWAATVDVDVKVHTNDVTGLQHKAVRVRQGHLTIPQGAGLLEGSTILVGQGHIGDLLLLEELGGILLESGDGFIILE